MAVSIPAAYLKDTVANAHSSLSPRPVNVAFWNDLAAQWYRHVETIKYRNDDTAPPPTSHSRPFIRERPAHREHSKDKEIDPGFRNFLVTRPYIIKNGTYFHPIQTPTWDFEHALFPITLTTGKPGPSYLPDTPVSNRHEGPTVRHHTYWYHRFGGLAIACGKFMTYYEFKASYHFVHFFRPNGWTGGIECWSKNLEGVPFRERCLFRGQEPIERCGYFRPVVRPVWEFELAFVGNGFVP